MHYGHSDGTVMVDRVQDGSSGIYGDTASAMGITIAVDIVFWFGRLAWPDILVARHERHERNGAAAWPPVKGQESRMKVHMQKVFDLREKCCNAFAWRQLLPPLGYVSLPRPSPGCMDCTDSGLASSGSAGCLRLGTPFLIPWTH